MPPAPAHLYVESQGVLTPTELVRGPWDHGLQHGGAVCGALGWAARTAVEATTDGPSFALCRQTTEILRPVPVAPLRYETSIERAGARSRVVSVRLWLDDRCVARASTQWARPAAGVEPGSGGGLDSRPDPAVPIRPVVATDPDRDEVGYPRPGFNCDVFELRCLEGTTEDPGPGTTWVRMQPQLIAGSANHPVDVLATVADLANAVGWEPSVSGAPMVNADVTLQVLRYPVGEWVCLEAASRSTGAGIGMTNTVLWDGQGQLGRVLSTTMESAMPLTVELQSKS